jgi:hypothetical protein
MNTNDAIISPEQARIAARGAFLRLHPNQELWFDLAWQSQTTSAVPSEGALQSKPFPGLGVSGSTNQITKQMAQDFAVLATTFIIQSPVARSEMMTKLKAVMQERGKAKPVQEWVRQLAEELLDAAPVETESAKPCHTPAANFAVDRLAVWVFPAHDIGPVMPIICTPAGVRVRFWNRRHKYDLFIQQRQVFAPKIRKDELIQLAEDEYRALTQLLINKGNPLAPVAIYRHAYKNEGLIQGLTEADILTSHIKSLISRLRKYLIPAVPSLEIPDKRTMDGYAIQGVFEACLILPASSADPAG